MIHYRWEKSEMWKLLSSRHELTRSPSLLCFDIVQLQSTPKPRFAVAHTCATSSRVKVLSSLVAIAEDVEVAKEKNGVRLLSRVLPEVMQLRQSQRVSCDCPFALKCGHSTCAKRRITVPGQSSLPIYTRYNDQAHSNQLHCTGRSSFSSLEHVLLNNRK